MTSSLLSYLELEELVHTGVIEGAFKESINSASIDIHMGPVILIERGTPQSIKRLDKKDQLDIERIDLGPEGSYCLAPGEFLLAQSREIFNLPNNISAEYKLKSSMARLGLDHLNAGWCDAGWHGSVLTLELKNCTQRHRIVLTVGDRIGQMVFFKHKMVPKEKSYAARGSYNGDKEAKGVAVK
jgi:deoxycytidine triphosphate deaminase